jgi:hypothetical protein
MYASEWIFGLFSSVVPIEMMGEFYSEFFENRWIFFYKFVLQILKTHQKELLCEEELYSILHQIKAQTCEINRDR